MRASAASMTAYSATFEEVGRDLDGGGRVFLGRVGGAQRTMELVLGLPLLDAAADLVERSLHRRLGLVPPGAAGFRGLTDGGLELADLGLERFVDLVTALLELAPDPPRTWRSPSPRAP